MHAGADAVEHGDSTENGMPIERMMLFLPVIGLAVAAALQPILRDQPLPIRLFSPYQSFPHFTAIAVLTLLATVRRFEIVPVLLLGTVLEAMHVALLLAQGRNVMDSWTTFGLAFWYASVAVGLWHVARSSRARRWHEVDRVLLRVAFPLAFTHALYGLWLTVQVIPATFDNVLYAFDGLLGPPVATFLAGLCRHNQAWSIVAMIVYHGLWLMMTLVLFAQCRTDQRQALGLMSRYILLGFVGWMLYFAVPGSETAGAFWNAYGDQLPLPSEVSLGRFVVDSGQPRNAMPSLHMSWALLLAMETRRMGRPWSYIGTTFAFATALATLGVGGHYLIDLVVAVPFTVSVYAGSFLFHRRQWLTERVLAAVGGAAMTALLLATIRFGTGALRETPWTARVLVVGVLSLSLALHFLAERRGSAAVALRFAPANGLC